MKVILSLLFYPGTKCLTPDLDGNAQVTTEQKTSYNIGDRVTYTCKNDNRRSVTITCDRGSWIGIQSCNGKNRQHQIHLKYLILCNYALFFDKHVCGAFRCKTAFLQSESVGLCYLQITLQRRRHCVSFCCLSS